MLQKCFAISIYFLLNNCYVNAQNIFPSSGSAGIGTTTPNASSILDMVSTSKGILLPRMTKTQRDAITSPATGLMVYQTNSTPGFYYYNGSIWTAVTLKAKGWSLTGNSGTIPSTNFIGTTDNQPLVFKVNNQQAGYLGTSLTSNTGFGYQTLNTNTSGISNVANGYQAMFNNTSGSYNSANGVQALYANTTGHDNTANGFWSLLSNTIGYYNTAAGGYALYTNSDGIGNTANGISSLRFNTHGSDNTAVGANTLFYNTTGHSNVAVGSNALFNNTTGNNIVAVGDSALYNQNGGNGYNTAVGSKALYTNTSGGVNTAIGSLALYHNTTGSFNTASGINALYSNTTGGSNTASGNNTLFNNMDGNVNAAFGYQALYTNVSGDYNTLVGAFADANNNNYDGSSAFGTSALITASNQVRIGSSSVTSIGGYQSWTTLPSDKRVKKNIKENVPGLAFINKLKPVTYNLDLNAIDKIVQRTVIKDKDGKIIQPSQQELDSRKVKEQILFTGFVAQDVAAAASSINYDFSGVDKPKNDKDIYGLRYSDFVIPLVKAVQELSKMNDSKDAKINDLETRLAKLEAMMNVQQSTSNISSASLAQNIPNPFSNTTTINYSLPQNSKSAQLVIIDNSGKVLKQVKVSGSGKSSVQINTSTLAAGAYQYSLFVDGKLIDTKQLILAK